MQIFDEIFSMQILDEISSIQIFDEIFSMHIFDEIFLKFSMLILDEFSFDFFFRSGPTAKPEDGQVGGLLPHTHARLPYFQCGAIGRLSRKLPAVKSSKSLESSRDHCLLLECA